MAAIAMVEDLAQMANIVKASSEDLEWLYPGTDPQTTLTRWARHGRLAVLTRGAGGALAIHADMAITQASTGDHSR